MFLKDLTGTEQRAFLELAHRAAWVDGTLASQEIDLLQEYRFELGLPESDYALQKLSIDEAVSAFKSGRSKRIALLELLALVQADGVTHPAESQLIATVQQAFGLSDAQRDRFDDWVKKLTHLYQEGAALLKEDIALANA